ncbi:hypothetical protein GQ600_19941 [Phytophthora cactorum]|nr:hypothetical protein GQ600_19941 [Phytophthora cactorum]
MWRPSQTESKFRDVKSMCTTSGEDENDAGDDAQQLAEDTSSSSEDQALIEEDEERGYELQADLDEEEAVQGGVFLFGVLLEMAVNRLKG